MTISTEASTAASQVRLNRGRRAERLSGDDRKLAILATAERLLEVHPLAGISVDDLAKGAGISRPTFYFYFASKEAVLLTLLDRVVGEADAALETLIESVSANEKIDRIKLWRNGIALFLEAFGSHKGVVRAGQSARATNAEVQQLWSMFMQKWISHTTDIILAERARGTAPDTLPAHELATTLNLLNERVFFASFTAEQPSVPEDHVLDVLVHIWLTSIYGARC